MVVERWTGYHEGADISMIPMDKLAYPSKNVLIKKGKVVTRGGLTNDGTAHTVEVGIHSEFHWKDAAGGSRFLRVHGQSVQLKYAGDHETAKWLTIFSALDSGVARVFFTTWVDANGAIIKKRLFFCDGSSTLYQWNGLVATVESVAGAGTQLTVEADKDNLGLMGADVGSVTNQTVIVYSLDGNGDVDAQEEEIYSNDPTGGLVITLDAAPSGFTPVAGDLVIAKPVAFANAIASTFDIDALINYKGHVVAASYDSVELHWSHIETYSLSAGLDFTQPVAASRTALTPIVAYLNGNFTGMGVRKGVMWVSDADQWYKFTKTAEINAYDLWVDVDEVIPGERKGCLPMAIANHKDDLIYFSQDKTLQRVTTNEVLQKDEFQLLSDDVEALFQRLDNTDVRLYYVERGVFIIFPAEGVLVILDTAEEVWYFQPPQDIPMSCMSFVGGIKYGHHKDRNETFVLFNGRLDLGAAMAEAIITHGLYRDGHHFRMKKHTVVGLDIRITNTTSVLWEREFEENADRQTGSATFVGENIRKFDASVDEGWATHPYASLPWAGGDGGSDLYRAFIFDTDRIDGYLEQRTKLTINASQEDAQVELHLLGIFIEDKPSERKIPSELFITR